MEGGEETKEEGDGDRSQSPQIKSPIIATPQEDLAVQEPEAVPLVVPAALFRPTSYHPMHIFVSHAIRLYFSFFLICLFVCLFVGSRLWSQR